MEPCRVAWKGRPRYLLTLSIRQLRLDINSNPIIISIIRSSDRRLLLGIYKLVWE